MRWEYAQLKLTRDPGSDINIVYGYLGLPDETTWTELGALKNTLTTLNDLGKKGWALLGPPSDVNSVFSYKAGNETWHDRAYWVERDFWLKRPVDGS
jgi:hypothetical protein